MVVNCLGFEYGYSVADPNSLVLWEAQFGDFANGAQIIVDNFLAGAEKKWQQTSGLVMLLPHGHEGQGPEHSSARPERFLQLCGNLNLQVANVTTPSQYFHMLRRQMKRDFRKPLIVMTPKSLLRDAECVSPTDHFVSEGFHEVLDDKVGIKAKKDVERLIFCTGKIYYEARRRAEELGEKGKSAIVRIEQLYPFPAEQVDKIIKSYKNVKSVSWIQEEPQNMGAWSFIRPRLEDLLGDQNLKYIGRRYSGTTAEGTGNAHSAEQARIIDEAFDVACAWDPKLVNSK